MDMPSRATAAPPAASVITTISAIEISSVHAIDSSVR
jgi:hypothetical protein